MLPYQSSSSLAVPRGISSARCIEFLHLTSARSIDRSFAEIPDDGVLWRLALASDFIVSPHRTNVGDMSSPMAESRLLGGVTRADCLEGTDLASQNVYLPE